MSEISVKNLVVDYKLNKKQTVRAVDNLSAVFNNGEFNVIIGQSGCGKSTLLKSILGLISYEGDIYLDDDDLRGYSIGDRNFSYVSQDIVLIPSATIFDNIAYPLKIRGVDKKSIVDKVYELADELDIRDCLSRRPKQISLGQAQRAAIAKALIKNASFYLFDEPFSNLDPKRREEGRHIIQNVVKKRSSSVIYVTHSIKEATSLADKVFVMDKGNIVFVGTPKELLECNLDIVKELVKADE